MFEKIKTWVSELKITNNIKFIGLAVIAIIVTALLSFFLFRSQVNYVALFGQQENVPVAKVIEVLSNESINYRVEPQSGKILVAEDRLPFARLALAQQGVHAILPLGYELMDEEASLGSSQFSQIIRFRRSLEGELAQSIMALEPVLYARVHLGFNESSSFVLNNQPKSSASVMVRLHYGQQLQDEQIRAILHLVAGSVPGLDAGQVEVVDQMGHLLSHRAENEFIDFKNIHTTMDVVRALQKEISQNISHLLIPVVGHDNFRISVMPQMDFKKVEQTQENYGTTPHLMTENLQNENSNDNLARGIPGTLSNLPNDETAREANTYRFTRNHSDKKYQYDRDILHIKHPGFSLNKLSVAIVINQQAPEVINWKEAELTKLNQLISDAIGLDKKRGDAFTLDLMAFIVQEAKGEDDVKWWHDPMLMSWIEKGIKLFLLMLVIVFGVLPLLRRLVRRVDGKANLVQVTDKKQKNINIQESLSIANTEVEEADDKITQAFSDEDNFPPQSSGLETKIAYMQKLAEIETERVAEVIKQWINTNDRRIQKSE